MMRLIFAGTPATAVPVAEHLSAGHEIAAVLTRPPAPEGRHGTPSPSPVARWAMARGIPVLDPPRVRDAREEVRRYAPECCVVVAYGGLITSDLLAVPRWGWINLHYSLLPAYRGAAPVQRALLDGCTQTGVTTFRLVRALDAGPVYVSRATAIEPAETAGDLLTRLGGIGAQALSETLELVAAGVEPTEQDETGVSLAPKLDPGEARLDLTQPSAAVVNRVRAMSPEPGAWATLNGQRFKVLRAKLADGPDGCVPGDMHPTKQALLCRTGDGWIDLVEVQAPGRRAMPGAAWARGAWREGDRLG